MARSMLSVGMLFWRAVVTAVRSRGFALMSPPPSRAATVISLMNLVKSLPRRASLSAFLCLIELHLEWPDMARCPAVPQAPRRVNHESQGERGIARALRASIMRRDAGRDAEVGGALARRRRGLRARARTGSAADHQRRAGGRRLLVRPGLPRQPYRQRRDLRPVRADGRASLAAPRHARHGDQPGERPRGSSPHQRPRPVRRRARHRPLLRRRAHHRHGRSRHGARPRRGARLGDPGGRRSGGHPGGRAGSAAEPAASHRLVHGRGRRAQRSRQGRAPPPGAGAPLPRRLRHPARGHERPLLPRAHRSLPAAHRRARARRADRAARLSRHHHRRARAVRRSVALLVVLALLAGCASRRLVRHGQVNEDALETVRRGLVALRGLAFTTPVPVLALSRDGLGAVVKEEIEQSYSPGDIEHAEAVYTRLGLLPPGTKLRPALEGLYQPEGAGFYDPRTKRLVVAESVPGAPSVGAGLLGFLTGRDLVSEFLVAHELTHALQDQHYHLPTRPEPLLDGHGDRELARHALLEGDATLAGFAYVLGRQLDRRMIGVVEQQLHGIPGELAKKYPDLPELLRASVAFQYDDGTAFVGQALAAGGWAAVDRAHLDPPESTEQVLHPQRYYDDRDRPIAVRLGGTDGLEAAGFRRILEDTLGELEIRVLVARALPAQRAAGVAEGWGGDRLRALERGDDLVLVWMTAWDSSADAGEFADALPGLVPDASIERREERVLVLVGPPGIDGAALAARVWARTTVLRPHPESAGSQPASRKRPGSSRPHPRGSQHSRRAAGPAKVVHREHDVDHRGLELCASASRCPSRNSVQKRARASAQPPPSSLRSVFAAIRARRLHNDAQRRASASRRRFCILAHPHEVGRPPSPSAALTWHGARPDLFAPGAAEPEGATARWMAPGM